MQRPIVPWMGGKRRLAKQIIPLLPDHTCYVEPFCGGAAIFWLREHPARCEVVKHHLGEFVGQFRWALTSRKMFEWTQQTPSEVLTDIQRAASFFYLQQLTFGARPTGRTFGTATTTPAFNLLRIEEFLSDAHIRLAGVTIENLSWQQCVERYDRDHSVFYLDPPYWQMAEAMASMRGKALLSINDHPDIRAIFGRFEMRPVEIRYSVGRKKEDRKVSKELLIANYPLAMAEG